MKGLGEASRTKMNGTAEQRRSQKLGKNTNRASPRLPSKRRREKSETGTASTSKNCHDAKENGSNVRGNMVQGIWEATQRTVKLIKPESVSRVGDSVHDETKSGQVGVCATTKDESYSSMGCIARRGARNTPTERKNHFQVVMAELKYKSRPKNGSKDPFVGSFKEKESPTAINCMSSSEGEDVERMRVPLNIFDNSVLSPPCHGTSGNVKNWLSKATIFQKGPSPSERSLHALTTTPRRPFRNISPGPRTSHLPSAYTDIDGLIGLRSDSGTPMNPESEDDAYLHIRRGSRFIRPFRRKGGFEVFKRSWSLGQVNYDIDALFDENFDREPPDVAPDTRMVEQVHELLRVMDVSEDNLANLRIQGERNSFELRSEIRRLNQMIISMTHTQELRYCSLLDSLHENCRTLGQVESGFDYFLTIMNRQKRSSIGHRSSRWLLFFLDHIVASLLTIVYVITRVYSHYRFKRTARNGRTRARS